MELKVIKTTGDYESALSEFDRLASLGVSSTEGDTDAVRAADISDRLELLAFLIDRYEAQEFPIELPDPVSAIKFVMDQRGLTPRDLIPYIGSRSKVSEVLSGTRNLSISMMRALHKDLGIPAEVLLRKAGEELDDSSEIEWDKFPLREMLARNWISGSWSYIKTNAEDVMRDFLAPFGGHAPLALYKKRSSIRASVNENPYALEAWRVWVALQAEKKIAEKYRPELIDASFLAQIAKFSRPRNGPLLAQNFLLSYGIILLVEQQLKGTYLDGASFFSRSGNPIVALTLRYDRIDHFWFVLLHELVHVWKHLNKEGIEFIADNFDVDSNDLLELEADNLAQQAFIPNDVWENSDARHLESSSAAKKLADELRIHPALVAGRIRYETKNYKKLSQLLGQGEIRKLFLESV